MTARIQPDTMTKALRLTRLQVRYIKAKRTLDGFIRDHIARAVSTALTDTRRN